MLSDALLSKGVFKKKFPRRGSLLMVRQGCVVVGHTMNYFLALSDACWGPSKAKSFYFFIIHFIIHIDSAQLGWVVF